MVRMMLAVAGVAITASSALAAPLNLVPPAVPNKTDVTASFATINYNATTDVLTISGYTSGVVVAPNASISQVNPSLPGTWTLSATIDASGNIGNGGVATLLISGAYPGPGSSVLLTSITLSQFGFDFTNGLTLEFVFDPAGGTLNPSGSPVGVIVRDTSLTSVSSFNSSFTNDSMGLGIGTNSTADAFLIPAPATAVLGLGGVMLAGRRRR